MIRTFPIVAALALAAQSAPASAVTVFGATLSGASETMPNPSTATGFGTLTLSDDMNSLSVFLSWTGLTGPAVAGHVHCCALQGANASVAIGFAPSAVATGSLNQTFNLDLGSIYNPMFVTANGGTTASAKSAFLAGLNGGRAYFNIHTAAYPSGEIRGQLGAVPEASTWGMMILGFGAAGVAMRTRRRRFARA